VPQTLCASPLPVDPSPALLPREGHVLLGASHLHWEVSLLATKTSVSPSLEPGGKRGL
jgi:hypothetical protein